MYYSIYIQILFKLGILGLIALMGFLTSDWLQWSAFGLGMYALFSWIQNVKIKDPVQQIVKMEDFVHGNCKNKRSNGVFKKIRISQECKKS